MSIILQTTKILIFVMVAACFALVNCQSSTQINCAIQEAQNEAINNPALVSCVTMFGVSSLHASDATHDIN